MALDFPSSPTLNQTYAYNGYSWYWDGVGWQSQTITSVTGPQGPTGPSGITYAVDPLSFNSLTKTISLKIKSGGGILGNNSGIYVDSSVIPTLSSSNTFTGANNIFSGNVTLSGKVLFSGYDFSIIPLDDISNQFDGHTSTFELNYQGDEISLKNPFRLLISLGGIIQSVTIPEVIWNSPLKKSGIWVDSNGNLNTYGYVKLGSSFFGLVQAGEVVNSTTTFYPFSPMDLLLGD
jgi:hypothetical protein